MENGCGGCWGIPFGYFGVVAKRRREDAMAEFIEREHKVPYRHCTAVFNRPVSPALDTAGLTQVFSETAGPGCGQAAFQNKSRALPRWPAEMAFCLSKIHCDHSSYHGVNCLTPSLQNDPRMKSDRYPQRQNFTKIKQLHDSRDLALGTSRLVFSLEVRTPGACSMNLVPVHMKILRGCKTGSQIFTAEDTR